LKINNKIDNVIVEIKKLWKLLKIDSFKTKGAELSSWFKSLSEVLLYSTNSDSVNNNKITLK